jgi:hypothetical protein
VSAGDSLGIIEFHDEDGAASADAGKFQLQAFRGTDKDAPDFKLIGSDAGGTLRTRFQIADSGDISFYEDTGTTPKLFWDASAESLGIGTSSPTSALDVTGTVTADGLTVVAADAALAASIGSNGQRVYITPNSNEIIYNASGDSAGQHVWQTGNTERMRIDASGNVGIGTSSPAAKLHATGTFGTTLTSGIRLDGLGTTTNNLAPIAFYTQSSNWGTQHAANIAAAQADGADGGAYLRFSTSPDGNTAPAERLRIDSSGTTILTNADGSANLGRIQFSTQASTYQILGGNNIGYMGYKTGGYHRFFGSDGVEDMRIDGSGNLLVGRLLVGKSDTTFGIVGVENRGDGRITSTRSGNTNLLLNRLSTDGDIVQFYKDGVTVGSIGVANGNNLTVGGAVAGHIGLQFGTGIIYPTDNTGAANDAAVDIGASGQRFKDLYLSGGVVFGTTGGAVSSKTLDDYEEGTWTPTLIAFGGASVGVTYFAQQGYYTKVGRLVQATGKLYVNSVGSSTGDFTITGLPFTLSASANSDTAVAIRTEAVSYADVPAAYIVAGTSYITFTETTNAGTGSNLTNSNIAFGSLITLRLRTLHNNHTPIGR